MHSLAAGLTRVHRQAAPADLQEQLPGLPDHTVPHHTAAALFHAAAVLFHAAAAPSQEAAPSLAAAAALQEAMALRARFPEAAALRPEVHHLRSAEALHQAHSAAQAAYHAAVLRPEAPSLRQAAALQHSLPALTEAPVLPAAAPQAAASAAVECRHALSHQAALPAQSTDVLEEHREAMQEYDLQEAILTTAEPSDRSSAELADHASLHATEGSSTITLRHASTTMVLTTTDTTSTLSHHTTTHTGIGDVSTTSATVSTTDTGTTTTMSAVLHTVSSLTELSTT